MSQKISSKSDALIMANYCRAWIIELEADPRHAEQIAKPILGYFRRARVRAWKRRAAHYERLAREI